MEVCASRRPGFGDGVEPPSQVRVTRASRASGTADAVGLGVRRGPGAPCWGRVPRASHSQAGRRLPDTEGPCGPDLGDVIRTRLRGGRWRPGAGPEDPEAGWDPALLHVTPLSLCRVREPLPGGPRTLRCLHRRPSQTPRADRRGLPGINDGAARLQETASSPKGLPPSPPRPPTPGDCRPLPGAVLTAHGW